MKLIQTRIISRDVMSLANFYQKLTGVAPDGGDEYVEFDFAGGLAICSKRSVDMFNGGAGFPAANHSIILDFQVEDVDKERERLGDLIKEFVIEPTDQPWGNRSLIFRDPEGNLINFFTVIKETSENCASAAL